MNTALQVTIWLPLAGFLLVLLLPRARAATPFTIPSITATSIARQSTERDPLTNGSTTEASYTSSTKYLL